MRLQKEKQGGMDWKRKRISVIYSTEICVCSMQNAAFVSRQKSCRLRVKMLCSVHQQSPAPGSIGCLSPSVDLPPAKVAVTPKVVSFPCDRCTQWLVKGGVTTHRPPGLESGHLKVTLPLPPPSPLLSSFQVTPPRSLPNCPWQPTHFRSISRASSLRQVFSWNSDRRNTTKLSFDFPSCRMKGVSIKENDNQGNVAKSQRSRQKRKLQTGGADQPKQRAQKRSGH